MNDVLTDLGDQLYLVDLHALGQPGHSSAYIYNGHKKVLIETGASPSHPYIVAALQALGHEPEDLDFVIVSHIHLDHAGGAGILATAAPRAQFIAHPRAARHLIDPSRLVQSAQAVYGDQMERLFGPIVPVPSDRVVAKEDGDTLSLGNRTLHFFHTPGHAKHHFCVFDPDRRAIFSGDALGIRYVKQFTNWGFEEIFPSASPTDFDPEGVEYTVQKMRALNPTTVYHTHFGPSPADQALNRTLQESKGFAVMADRVYKPKMAWEEMAQHLTGYLRTQLRSLGHDETVDVNGFGIDIELNAKGLLFYELKKHAD